MVEVKKFDGGTNGIPQFEDRKAMWKSLRIETTSIEPPSIRAFVKHLSTYYSNGSVQYGCFRLGDSEVLDWYCSRNKLKEMPFFRYLWEQEPIKSYFNLGRLYEESNSAFDGLSPFSLGGSLARVLAFGGAYQRPSWGGAESKAIGEEAALALIESDYEHSLVFESLYAWCDFFNDVAWDYSWVVLNKKTRLLHVLMATDTD